MKKTFWVIIIVLLIIGAGYFALNFVVKSKISSALNKQADKGRLSYSAFHYNLLDNTFRLDFLRLYHQKDTVLIDNIELKDLSYWAYLTKNTIKIGNITIDNPDIRLQKKERSKKDENQTKLSSKEHKLDKSIAVGQIDIRQGKLTIKEDTLKRLQLDNYNLSLEKIKAGSQTLQKKIPFTYQEYSIDGSGLYYHASKLQTVKIDSLNMSTDEATLHHLRLIPNYTRQEYVKVIPYEKDLMKIDLQSLKVHHYDFDLEHPRFESSVVEMDSIDIDIYRNKLVKDDPHRKDMYSRMLRELSLQLNIDSLKVRGVDLDYQEVQEKTGRTGRVYFKKMDITATDLTNIDLDRKDFPTTKIDVSTQFYGAAPLNVDWQFKINQPSDNFRIKGEGHHIPTERVNLFFEPGLNMKAEGDEIKDLYFDFSGNDDTAGGQFKIVYDDLKIKVLKNEGREKSGFLSAVANLFVKHKSKSNKEAVKVSDVKRNKTRSFWNYFWNLIYSGLKKSMI